MLTHAWCLTANVPVSAGTKGDANDRHSLVGPAGLEPCDQPIMQEQRGPGVCLARTGKECVLVFSCIRIVAIGMWTGADVALKY
jgi:hypothetical protein